jgi:hypothetical protein
MFHLSGPKAGHRIVPPKHFERLYAERHPPEGLAILVGYNDVGPVNKVWQFDHFGIELFLPPLLGERQGVARAGYAMTIRVLLAGLLPRVLATVNWRRLQVD